MSNSELARVLAQAPVVSAAFGRWLGFIVIMTTLLISFAFGIVSIVLAMDGAARLLG
jgi:hypothetical protein